MPVSFDDHFLNQLRYLYNAQTQVLTELSHIEKAATNPELKKEVTAYSEAEKKNRERLDKIFNILDASPEGEHSAAMAGVISEKRSFTAEKKPASLTDLDLIATLHQMEYSIMAKCEFLKSAAEELHYGNVAKELTACTETERKFSERFRKLEKGTMFSAAMDAGA